MEKLTKKQKGFVKDYLNTGNGQESALRHYDIEGKDKEAIARSIASQNLTKLNIREAIESHAPAAQAMIYKLSQEGEAEVIRLNASRDIMDRAGFKPIDKSVNLNVDVEGELTDEVKELTKRLDELDRTRTKSITSNGVTSNALDKEIQD